VYKQCRPSCVDDVTDRAQTGCLSHRSVAYTVYFTCIDHFFTYLNNDIILNVDSIDTNDGPDNFSDHIPLLLSLSGDIRNLFLDSVSVTNTGHSSKMVNTPNFDLANYGLYYEHTRLLLEPILSYLNLNCLHHINEAHNSNAVNDIYDSIIAALSSAASASVPSHTKSYKKCWWGQHMTIIKELAIKT